MIKKYGLRNLDCANCAAKIEAHLKKLPTVKGVVVNYATLTLHIDTDDIEGVRREIKRIEPDVELTPARTKEKLTLEASREEFSFKKELATIVVAFILFVTHLLFEDQLHNTPWHSAEYLVALAAYFLAGWNVLVGAFRTIRKGHLFDENVLMTIATGGAFAIHALSEAVGVMIFFKVGEFLQNLAVSRSRRSIRGLLEIRPDYAHRKTDSGLQTVSPEQVEPGDVIIVKVGEKIPLDGIIEEGTAQVNTSALTGESVPATVRPGDVVLAGEINTNALLTVRVTKAFAESSIAKILDLVENATAKKAKTEQFITRFARYYTPVVVFLSLAVALIPPLLISGETFSTWIYRALVLLVISCPCALVVSIPLGYFGGIGGASKRGLLVKGSNFLDALTSVKMVVFDKTGTLTQGAFRVKEVVGHNGFSEERLLAYAALAETHSNHPIAKSIVEAASHLHPAAGQEVLDHRELSGLGVVARTQNHTIMVGKAALLHMHDVEHATGDFQGTIVHVAIDDTYAGYITIGDELKDDAQQAVVRLRAVGVHSIGMLTGDNDSAAQSVARHLKLDFYHAGLLPEDKIRMFESIESEKAAGGKIAFVGDGINDAPVLARADVGIAMGALGSDAAIETADVVLMTDHPSMVAEAIGISRKTRSIVWQNIIFALAVKGVFISFGAFGLAGMWEAVFADMGTALLAILNATRALKQ
ncbi:MAG: heavy metal translocating P-type ATPase [Chitinivibrionales bacterium]